MGSHRRREESRAAARLSDVHRRRTRRPALALSKGLDRDRVVDETGHQIAVFGRLGSRPMTLPEQQKIYLQDGKVWTVTNDVDMSKYVAGTPKKRLEFRKTAGPINP